MAAEEAAEVAEVAEEWVWVEEVAEEAATEWADGLIWPTNGPRRWKKAVKAKVKPGEAGVKAKAEVKAKAVAVEVPGRK